MSDVPSTIRRVLLDAWDPRAIREDPAAHALYDCHVDDLTLLVLGGASDAEIAEYLRSSETGRLRLDAADESRIARAVAALRDALGDRRPEA